MGRKSPNQKKGRHLRHPFQVSEQKTMKKFIKAAVFLFVLCICINIGTVMGSAATASSKAGKVVTESTSLNLRSSASTSGTVVAKAKKGSYLTLLEKSGSWWKVEYAKDKTAYAHSDYIDTVSSKVMYVATTSGNLNVRSSASADASIKTTLPRNTIVLRLSTKSSWSRILYNGNKTGYVSSKYLTETKGADSYQKIALSVKSYKQTDSRWSSVKIGTQGDTIGSSGCTTTALAMTESFHQNKTITPKDMAKTLSYSSSGMLYWPTNYSTELISSSNYLSKIYSVLKSGKPVVVGMKKSNGSQHWVVVTGHTKSTSSLSAKNFTINDPGSNTRTLLSEFASSYPVPYKIAYRK